MRAGRASRRPACFWRRDYKRAPEGKRPPDGADRACRGRVGWCRASWLARVGLEVSHAEHCARGCACAGGLAGACYSAPVIGVGLRRGARPDAPDMAARTAAFGGNPVLEGLRAVRRAGLLDGRIVAGRAVAAWGSGELAVVWWGGGRAPRRARGARP